MPKPFVLAIADIHLTLTKPACRAEEDWLGVQRRYLEEVRDIQAHWGVPLLCAGDIFDKWNPAPELIHFAIKELPDGMICVPGQHDLPNHRIDQQHRSGYGVLAAAGKIQDVAGKGKRLWTDSSPSSEVWGSGWEQNIQNPNASKWTKIALIHRYVWVEGKGFPGAPQEANLPRLKKELGGYDWAIFGDNHKPFLANCHPNGINNKACIVINCGPLFRRKVDEIPNKPCVWGLCEDSKVEKYPLVTDKDEFLYTEKEKEESEELDISQFLKQLEDLGEHGFDFREIVRRNLKTEKMERAVREIILTALQQ